MVHRCADDCPHPQTPPWSSSCSTSWTRLSPPFTVACWCDVQPDHFLLIGEVPPSTSLATQQELLLLNNQLAVMSRENLRKGRELEKAQAQLKQTLEDLQTSHWHLKQLQEGLPICMDCGKVKS